MISTLMIIIAIKTKLIMQTIRINSNNKEAEIWRGLKAEIKIELHHKVEIIKVKTF